MKWGQGDFLHIFPRGYTLGHRLFYVTLVLNYDTDDKIVFLLGIFDVQNRDLGSKMCQITSYCKEDHQ